MQVTLPEMGESVTEGTVAKWLKQPGDPVREGEALVEVTTDKVDAEVPAPATGTLTRILAEAGKTIGVGAPLADIAVGAGGDGAAEEDVKWPPRFPCGARLRRWSSTWRKASRCRQRRASARCGSTSSTNGVVSSTSVCRKPAARRRCPTPT